MWSANNDVYSDCSAFRIVFPAYTKQFLLAEVPRSSVQKATNRTSDSLHVQ